MIAGNQKIQIPNLFTGKVVDKDGFLTPEALAFFNQLLVSLQYILSPEGVRVPQQPSANLGLLTVPGALVYTNDTNTLQVNLAGIFHQIMTS